MRRTSRIMGTNLEKFNLKAFATVILLFPGFMLCAADSNRNYIRHTVLTDTSGTQGIETVKYYDGLGRHVETVALGAGGGGEDLVSYNVLDGLGRTVRAYNPTPVATGDGGFTALQALETAASTEWNDASPYTSTEYEPAPEGRPVSATGPGNAWHSAGKAVKIEYLANDPAVAELDCRCFDAGDTRAATSTLVEVKPEGKYAEGSLYVTRTTDEDGHVRLEFTDLFGKTVLRRVKNGSEYLDTYYVYDIALNLAAVLPPKLSASLGAAEKVSSATGKGAKLGYFYISDWEGRCRAKKLPGCEWQLFAYTPGGRLVYSQDGVQRPKGECSFFFTDAFGRECVRGTIKRNLTLAGSDLGVPVTASRSGASSTDGLGGYAVQNSPIFSLAGGGSNLKAIHKITYYDDYDFLAGKTYASELAYRAEGGYDARYVCADIPAISAKGWMTGALTYVLGTTTALASTYYYDHHGNLVQSHEQNILGGYEHYYYHLTFTGKPLAVKHVHTGGQSGTITEVYAYTYDSQERLLTATLSRNGGTAELLASNTYDKFGRLKSVKHGASAGTVSYGYNVRGWVKSLDAGWFRQILGYQDNIANTTPCYNGNIGFMRWNWSINKTSTDTYYYKYDGADRLITAKHLSTTPLTTGAQRPNYNVSYTYDQNSNMTTLKRYGILLGTSSQKRYSIIDNLTMGYDGNQLLKVDDTASELTYAGAMDFKDYADTDEEYVYDANGNMTADLNKEMSVTYNELNLPSRYWFDGGHYINLQYTADGALVRKIYGSVAAQMAGEQGLQAETMAAAASESRLEERCGNHVFYDKVLERSYNDYGYWVDGAYHYNICDYLGNVRTVVKSDGTLCERNDYYPFGMLHDPTAANADVQPRKYGGKELDRQNGLDLYDSQARWYDPILARTTTMDAKAESYYDISPYVWCGANPMRNIDPTGMFFTEASEGFLDRLSDEITKRQNKNYESIAKSLSKLMQGNLSDKKVDKHVGNILKSIENNNALSQVEAEIKVLRNSSQVYNICYDSSMNQSDYVGLNVISRGGLTFNLENKYVNIMLGDTSVGLLAHELKHAYQFETGTLSVSVHKDGFPLYDKTDEIEAYQRGALFGIPFNGLSSAYDILQEGPVDVNNMWSSDVLNSAQSLRYVANSSKSIFRHNGTTYIWNKFK